MKTKNKLNDENTQDKLVNSSDTESKRKDKVYVGGDDATRPLEYDPPSDEELLKVAEATYASTKDKAVETAKQNTEKQKKSVYESINDKIESTEKGKNNLALAYDKAKSNLEDQSLRRGIQRSSQAIGGFKELESEKLDKIAKLDEDTKKYVDSLNAEIRELESDLGKEISSINEKYANAVQVRLNQLKNERAEKINEVIKYNNKLETFYPADYYENGGELNYYDDYSNYDVESVDLEEVKERYRDRINEVIRDYLAFDDAKEAFELFKTNDSCKRYLGKYYGYVYKVLSNHADISEEKNSR